MHKKRAFFVSFVSEGSIADYVTGETHKITQATRKQPKHNPLLLNKVYTTVSERPILYLYHPIYTYILYKVWKRHTAERQ